MEASEVGKRTRERVVHIEKGRPVVINAGKGVKLQVERFDSGEVIVKNLLSGTILRQFSPKEASGR